eukprot:TRINITY_DN5815_c0_g3_i1.p1 TRINITY_DN5815_c0_g3~~TRINITY_DN5815_c0_g3_i1.p1  ORF type:complete len:322 (-),score=63.90 TRINITY_DN5815_c0_g3_i1:28-993(-)
MQLSSNNIVLGDIANSSIIMKDIQKYHSRFKHFGQSIEEENSEKFVILFNEIEDNARKLFQLIKLLAEKIDSVLSIEEAKFVVIHIRNIVYQFKSPEAIIATSNKKLPDIRRNTMNENGPEIYKIKSISKNLLEKVSQTVKTKYPKYLREYQQSNDLENFARTVHSLRISLKAIGELCIELNKYQNLPLVTRDLQISIAEKRMSCTRILVEILTGLSRTETKLRRLIDPNKAVRLMILLRNIYSKIHNTGEMLNHSNQTLHFSQDKFNALRISGGSLIQKIKTQLGKIRIMIDTSDHLPEVEEIFALLTDSSELVEEACNI